ncbi:MAG: hypothetical protein GF344_05830, partial [Chitinivibrionales bacterium]|nr:hypothetical protein [Chitinivibrionales bacterium]MBD3356485.1 hypothetical protein [Chitinivibrionales bacterium]
MNKHTRFFFGQIPVFILTSTSIVLLLSCIEEVNPYDIPEAAEIVWRSSNPADGDTIDIFTTYTLEGEVLLPKHVDEIVVIADNAVGWDASPYRTNSEGRAWPKFSFGVSFADTGFHYITVKGYLADGDSIVKDLRLFTVSPLDQADLRADYGELVELKTPRVGDDVLYVWRFDGGRDPIRSDTNSAKFVVNFLSTSAELYVEKDSVQSPSCKFTVTVTDKKPPEISLIGAEMSPDKDTVYMSPGNTTLTIGAVDQESGLSHVTVNGVHVDCWAGKCVYQFDPPSGIAVSYRALDIIARDVADNEALRELTIYYDPQVLLSPELIILNPEADSQSTNKPVADIRGYIRNNDENRDMAIVIRQNGTEDTVLSARGDFSVKEDLKDSVNHIEVLLFRDDEVRIRPLDKKSFTLFYRPEVKDTTPPEIKEFRVGDSVVTNGYTTALDEIVLKVLVVDPNSEVASVWIDNKQATRNSSGYFSRSVQLAHTLEGNAIAVLAANSDLISTDGNDEITIYRNGTPSLTMRTAKGAKVNTSTTDTVNASDPDGDKLTISA